MKGMLKLYFARGEGIRDLPSGIAVRIERATSTGDGPPTAWSVLVPTSPNGLSVEVDAGTYMLQAWLPSGQILQYRANVEEVSETLVELRPPMSRATADTGYSLGMYRVDLSKEYDPFELQPAFTSEFDDEPTGMLDICRETPSFVSWTDIPGRIVEIDGEIGHGLDVSYDASTNALSISAIDGHNYFESQFERWWVRVRHDRGESLGVLPLGWLSGTIQSPGASVEVRFERVSSHLDVTVRDSRLDALLEYLKAGRLSAAAASVAIFSDDNTIVHAIRDKRSNPLAACAAAYVSLATADREQIERWRNWAPNLMNFFPWMPDGAIIRACTLMDGPVSSDTRSEILQLAKEAFNRGLPFFTVGFRHLRDIFTIFSADDAEAKQMLGRVRSMSSRCEISEAFTTLQFPRH